MHENPQSNNPITYVLLNPYLLNHRITSSKKIHGQKFTLESPNFNKISEETKYTRQVQSSIIKLHVNTRRCLSSIRDLYRASLPNFSKELDFCNHFFVDP